MCRGAEILRPFGTCWFVSYALIDDQNFEEEVRAGKPPILLDFTAQWCPPCRALEPHLEQLLRENEGRLRIAKVDVDQNPRLTTLLGVHSAPTLILFREGRPVRSQVGLLPLAGLRRLVADE